MPRVLIVEDEHLFRRIITMNLVRCGYSVAEADSVASAREALAAWDPAFDVVLLDIELPDGTGWDVLRHLGEMATAPPGVASPRIVIVTVARPRQAHLDSYRHDAVLIKPFPVQALLRVIERVCGAPPATRGLQEMGLDPSTMDDVPELANTAGMLEAAEG